MYTENNISFLRVPRFLRVLVTSHGAELYALLRERRRWLMKYKKINDEKSWFYYTNTDIQHDLLPPNSTNHIKILLDKLENLNLIKTKITKSPSSIKHFLINDDAYFKLAQEEDRNWIKASELASEQDNKPLTNKQPIVVPVIGEVHLNNKQSINENRKVKLLKVEKPYFGDPYYDNEEEYLENEDELVSESVDNEIDEQCNSDANNIKWDSKNCNDSKLTFIRKNGVILVQDKPKPKMKDCEDDFNEDEDNDNDNDDE